MELVGICEDWLAVESLWFVFGCLITAVARVISQFKSQYMPGINLITGSTSSKYFASGFPLTKKSLGTLDLDE